MSIDVGLPAPVGEAALPRHQTLAVWLAIAAVFAAAIGLRAVLPFNVDVSWWLIVGERVLDGQRLYTDILETNPPMAGSVYFLGVVLARATDLRPEIVTNALVIALIAASVAVTWRILRDVSVSGRSAARPLAAWACALLGILPMYDFGQREHLALLLLLPALGVAIRRAGREPVTYAMMGIAGVSAALTMSFKPYFACAVGCCSVAAALQARQWRVLVAPENWIAGILTALYGACVYVVWPDYFTLIYPLVRDVYLLLNAPWPALVVSGATALALAALAALLATLLLQRHRQLDAALVVLLGSALGFAIAFFLQRKGWGYHAYPMVALPLMALGYAIATLDRGGPRARALRFAASLVAAGLFANGCVWFNASVDVGRVEAAVARIHPRPKLMVLSAAAVIGHPMVRTLQGEWMSRQEAFWVREIVRRAVVDGAIDAPTAAGLAGHVARERDGIVADFRKRPPDVVLIDNHNSDWSRWVADDPELSALLAPYTRSETIDGIDIRSRPD